MTLFKIFYIRMCVYLWKYQKLLYSGLLLCIVLTSICYYFTPYKQESGTFFSPSNIKMSKQDLSEKKYFKSKAEKVLGYIADHLQVRYEVLSNFPSDKKLHQIEFINGGNEFIPNAEEIAWSVYFNDLHLPEYDQLRLNHSAELPAFNFELSHVDGGLFNLKAMPSFQGIQPGESHVIRYSCHITVSRDYIMPRWYVAAPGERPFIIKSTEDDELQFVTSFTRENQWKRSPKDFENPLSLKKRFEKYFTPDLEKAPLRVIPAPVQCDLWEEQVNLDPSKWKICSEESFFRNEMKKLSDIFGIEISDEMESCASKHAIIFNKGTVDGVRACGEAYEIDISVQTQVIEITASDHAGAFYAIQTLLSLAEADDGKLSHSIPSGVIKDAPRYDYRGLHIDVSRNFLPLPDLLEIIEIMAMYKLNKLHLHLTDDEGWRIEIEGLPELTEIGAFRCHADKEEKALFPALGSGPHLDTSGSGFYSADDYKRILEAATANHIEVIPEVDLPGHSHAAIRAMEARYRRLLKEGKKEEAKEFLLSDLDDESSVMSVQHFTNNAVNPCLDSTYNFVDHVIGFLKNLHDPIQPLTTVHIGGDEVANNSWTSSPACQQLVEKAVEFPKRIKDLQEFFIRKVAAICKENYNLNMGVWEEGALDHRDVPLNKSSLSDCDVIANAWTNAWTKPSADRAHKLANAGFNVVMSHATHLYFDHPQEPDPEEIGLTWATRYIDDKMVFKFRPDDLFGNAETDKDGLTFSDKEISEMRENHTKLEKPEKIIGMQAQLWSELLRDTPRFHHQLFPRLIPFAERAWHQAQWETIKYNGKLVADDWAQFVNVVGYKELRRLKRRGIYYRIPPPGVNIIDGKFQVCSLYPGFKYLYRSITKSNNAKWLECVNGRPIPEDIKNLEFVTSDGHRHSRIVRMDPKLSSSNGQ